MRYGQSNQYILALVKRYSAQGLCLILVLLIVVIGTACQSPGTSPTQSTETVTNPADQTSLTTSQSLSTITPAMSDDLIIPDFSTRRFLWTNGLTIEDQHTSTTEDGLTVERYYPRLNGFKDESVEAQLNQQIQTTLLSLMQAVEADFAAQNTDPVRKVTTKFSTAYVAYNCNSVLFIEYFAFMEASTETEMLSVQKNMASGYDLNTGLQLLLKDLFKTDSNYEQLINEAIVLEIMKKNYDDPDAQYMSKPFQGIREGQLFSFDLTGLRIMIDERNNEFIPLGYPVTFTIPLRSIGDELAIFDRYMRQGDNLFDQPGLKKLLLNQIEYAVNNVISEYEQNYDIYIETGEFTGIDDPFLKTSLDSLNAHDLDIDGFRTRAQAQGKLNPDQYYGSLIHSVGLMMNEGGYLSVLANDSSREKDQYQHDSRVLNVNLNQNKNMTLAELFVQGFDYKQALVAIMVNSENYLSPDGAFLDEAALDTLSDTQFNFDPYGVTIYLVFPGRKPFESGHWISYEQFGLENITLFQ